MSKAFTSEESADPTVVGRPARRAAPGARRPITPRGHAALVEELRRLSEEERPRLRRGELPDAEARLARLEHRVRFLLDTLDSVAVAPPPEDETAVRLGHRVLLAWGDGRQQWVALVGADEADAATGAISIDAPLARALLGRGPGEEVEVRRPRGVETAVIQAITQGSVELP